MKNSPRSPSDAELAQLKTWIHDHWEWFPREYLTESDWHSSLWIAVFDDYVTGCPGYFGKVMCVINDGAPDWCDFFVWHGDQIIHTSSHNDLCKEK